MYICIDFDGTIVDHRYPKIGEPCPAALSWLRDWAANGAKLILFTMRSGAPLDEAVHFLSENNVPLHGINHNPDQASWSQSPKAYGHVYVDDAAFGCPLTQIEGFARKSVDWSIVGPAIRSMIA